MHAKRLAEAMIILLTVEFYWPHLGGAEEVTRRIAEGLVARGHEVHVATSADAGRKSMRLNGVTIHEFRVAGNEVKGLRGDVARYRHFLRTFACDVLFNYAAQSWSTDVAMQEMGQCRARRMVLAACGYSGLSTPLRRVIYRRYFKKLPARLKRYDLVIYHAARFRDSDFGRHHGVTRCKVIANGVQASDFSGPRGHFRERTGLGDQPLVVNVSNHYRLKRHDRYIRLASSLKNHAAFVLLGRDIAPAWQSCFKACRRNGLNGDVMLADGQREVVVEAIKDADILVFTSASEVAPLVLLEASAAGTPWVSFDVGNARDLQGGLVVGAESDLVQQVGRLCDDPTARVRLGHAGMTFAEGHAWEKKVSEYEQALFSVCADARSDVVGRH
jgi:glycosyltransferase involved in cell wall biosynthesis